MCSKFLYLRAEYKNLRMLHNFLNGTKQPILHREKKRELYSTLYTELKTIFTEEKKIGSYLSRRTEIKNTPCFFLFFLSAASFLTIIMRDYFFFFTSCIIATCTFVIFLGSSVPVSRTSTFWYTFGEFIHFVLPASL